MTNEIIRGLTSENKTLPVKLFFDKIGSQLFDQITEQPEYYVCRTESALLAQHAGDIISALPFPKHSRAALVEFGASNEKKALSLLKARKACFSRYVAIDISATVLEGIRVRMGLCYPHFKVETIIGDFLEPLSLPATLAERNITAFFPGNTIANFAPSLVISFLNSIQRTFDGVKNVAFVIGTDMCRDPLRLAAAYNDKAGVQAAFHRNILCNVNRLADGNIEPDNFRHSAIWNDVAGRMEFDLVSRLEQDAYVAGNLIHFREGEAIRTGFSYKYRQEEFLQLASAAGWRLAKFWQDVDGSFGIYLLVSST